MAAPVPKPRTKFGDTSLSPRPNPQLDDVIPKSPPLVPPRPPAKPPRTAYNAVLGELRLNLDKEASEEDVPISPPTRMAPPPPRPPPPIGWAPEVMEVAVSSRPLPAIPVEELSPSITVENPIYLSLENYRSVSGIGIATPSPSNPSPNCDEIREWLTEEDRPEELNVSRISATSSSSQNFENAYTPCPRRSDYSGAEISDPFEDAFFTKKQNLYVSPEELKMAEKSMEKEVVEVCAPEELAHTYVNLGPISSCHVDPSSDSDEECLRDVGFQKMKIDGSSITFVGFVTLTSTKKEKRVHCRLRNMKLSFHEDEESSESINGPYDIKDFSMFRMDNSTVVIHVANEHKKSNSTVICSFSPEDPPNLWMFFISEAWLSLHSSLTAALRDADELAICGNVWIKYGSTGEWTMCSAGINRQTLYYMYSDSRDRIKRRSSSADELVDVDLRKIMAVRDRIDKTEFCPNLKHKRGPFSMTLHGVTLYIDSRDENTTNAWFEAIDGLLKKPASRLENYRLTGDNIPVIVDKCIRFVSAYGMKSEGIYRRNGKVTEAKTILAKLMEDPVGFYPVQEGDETVYAVADVLRQFFRKLDEPLFPVAQQTELFDLALESQSISVWNRYSEILEKMPTVHYSTLKKLTAHLRTISEHSLENRASVENLAKVFAASLFATDVSEEKKVFGESYNHQINVMIHLINGYDVVFQISIEEELSRQIVNDAEKKSLVAKKASPDLIVPVHVWEKENRPFNVKMSLVSEEVCREAVANRGFDGPPDGQYALFECLFDGNLIRRLPAGHKMSQSVLQWIDWDCKSAYLMFDHDKLQFDGDDLSCFTGKVKVAEPTTKSFKSVEVKIENGTMISAFRNEKLWKTWSVDDVIWYVGSENGRKPPNSHNLTMISTVKNENDFSHKFVGFCFSFKEDVERSRWMNALVHFTKRSEPLVYI